MILEAMYNGEFYPCETVVPTSPEYRKAIQTCAALMEQLSHRLSKEDYALVEELRAQNAIAQCEESESHFKYGFSAGLIVQQEAHEQLQNKKIGDGRKSPRSRKENRRRGLSVYMVILSGHPKFPQAAGQSRSDRSDPAKPGTFQTLSRQRLWQWRRSPCPYHAEYLPR